MRVHARARACVGRQLKGLSEGLNISAVISRNCIFFTRYQSIDAKVLGYLRDLCYISTKEERFLSSLLPAKPQTQPDFYLMCTGINPSELLKIFRISFADIFCYSIIIVMIIFVTIALLLLLYCFYYVVSLSHSNNIVF